MIMRYYGGGIGHLNNAPPQQADPLKSNPDKMDVEDDLEVDVVMNDGELEVDETEEEDGSGDDDDGDDSDNYDYHDDESNGGDENEDDDSDEEDDYGYASP